ILSKILKQINSTDSLHHDEFLLIICSWLDVLASFKNEHSQENYSQFLPLITVIHECLNSQWNKKYLSNIINNNENPDEFTPAHLFYIGTCPFLMGLYLDDPGIQLFEDLFMMYRQYIISYSKYIKDSRVMYCLVGIFSYTTHYCLISDKLFHNDTELLTCISMILHQPCRHLINSTWSNNETKLIDFVLLFLLKCCSSSKTMACFLDEKQIMVLDILDLVTSAYVRIRTSACLLLAQIIDVEQMRKYRICHKLTMKCLELLEEGYNQTSVPIDLISYSFLILSIHEDVQSLTAHLNIIPWLIKMPGAPFIYEIIWSLSFHQDIQQKLMPFKQQLQIDSKSSDTRVSKIAQGILWNLEPKIGPFTAVQFDAMISYCDNDKEIAQRIKIGLKAAGIKLCESDNNNMTDIDMSNFIIMCISEDYKHNSYCQAQVKYAQVKHKKLVPCIIQSHYRIDDWLTYIMENLIQVDFVKKNFKLSLNQLILQMYPQHDLTNNHLPTIPQVRRQSLIPVRVKSVKIKTKRLQDWLDTDVLEWCQQTKLPTFFKILTNNDGNSLLKLYDLSKTSSPQAVINLLKNDCRKQGVQLSFTEYIRFQSALEKLAACDDSNIVGCNGEIPLHTAARHEDAKSTEGVLHQQNGSVQILALSVLENMHCYERQSIIAYLMKHHGNICKKDNQGRTALHYAAMRNNHVNLKELIEFGAPVDVSSGHKNATALHFASRFNAVDCVKILIENHAVLDLQDVVGNTPLHSSMDKTSSLNIIDDENITSSSNTTIILLEAAKECSSQFFNYYLEIKNKYGKTAISVGCEHGQIHLVKTLLSYGANIHSCKRDSSDRFPAIHLAAKSGNINIIKLLLKNNVDIFITNIFGETALHIACKYNRIKVVETLIDKMKYDEQDKLKLYINQRDYQNFTPLLTASYFGHGQCIKLLWNNNVNVLCQDNHGKNILHICAERQYQDALKTILDLIKTFKHAYELLIDSDRHGDSVLHAAAKSGNFEICQMLIETMKYVILQIRTMNSIKFTKEYLAMILKKNLDKRTPLHEAAKCGNIAIFKYFFNNMNDNNLCSLKKDFVWIAACEDSDDELKTSLHIAAAKGHHEIVQLLVEKGSNVWACDMNDSTPLHEAAAKNQYLCAKILLNNQAPLNQVDGNHSTPLHLSSQYGHWKIVKLLLRYGADVQIENCDGYNAMEVAILNNHQIVVHEFIVHDTWDKSMRNAQIKPSNDDKEDNDDDISTPMRKLICYMPIEAEEVLNRCMTEVRGTEDYGYKIIYNYEFLEDQFFVNKWKNVRHSERNVHHHHLQSKIKNQKSILSLCKHKQQYSTVVYTTQGYTLQKNHPLFIMITSRQSDLLKHPLVDRLIKRKWLQFSRTFFWIFFIFYGFFLTSFTSAILRVKHSQYYYSLFNLTLSTASCETISLLIKNGNGTMGKKDVSDTTIKWVLWSTIILHVVKNVLLICVRFKMFLSMSNILELLALILSIIFSYDFYSWQMNVRFRCSFQWQCGAAGILIAWITLVIYVQFLSASGIYVVMLEVILRKFLRFIPILLVFILGFGFSFHMLLENQDVYKNTFDSLFRTALMLTGEINYEDHLYHPERNNGTFYYQFIYVLYMLFCVLMTILIMNLLIAHAVGEVPPLLERASTRHCMMRIKLIMDYEILLSTLDIFIPYLKRRIKILIDNNQEEVIYPNRIDAIRREFHDIKIFFSKNKIKTMLTSNDEKIDELLNEQHNLKENIRKLQRDVKEISLKVDSLTKL
ncbi:unnamed protein product, partial [Didymodactylos carnosus]